MADYRELEGDDVAMLAERADLVDQATAIVEGALDEVVAVTPTDEKGQGIVPDWEADYRRYLADRRAYSERLRNGEDVPFSETAIEGIPISERVERFASLAVENLGLSDQILSSIGEPVRVKQTVLDGSRTALDAFAVAVAVASCVSLSTTTWSMFPPDEFAVPSTS